MPISIEDFQQGEEVKAEARQRHQVAVLEFLKTNRLAYTAKEIAEKFDLLQPQARNVLMGLVKQGIVVRKQVNDGRKSLIYYAAIEAPTA